MEIAVDHRTPSRSTPPSRSASVSSARRQHPEALRDVLAELGERVKPITLARERTLPVAAPFERLLPAEGLVRGRVLSCRGVADTSLAFGLIAEALAAGAWAAMVDVATFGADAASEFGIPLERVVRVESGVADAVRSSGAGVVATWIDVMGAAVDGFDVVVTTVPTELRREAGRHGRRPAALRKLATRIQQKEAVVVVLGESGALSSDLVFSTEHTEWSGVVDGAGHLRSRIVRVAAGGRRHPVGRTVTLLLDGIAGRTVCSLAPAPETPSHVDHVVDLAEHPETERDPQAELLAEMTESLVAADGIDSTGDDEHRLAG